MTAITAKDKAVGSITLALSTTLLHYPYNILAEVRTVVDLT